MRIAVCADVHVGNHRKHGGPMVSGINTRCRQTLDVLRSAVAKAHELAGGLVIAGDLFDSDRPEPQVIAAVQEIFRKYPVPTLVIVGNHDQRSDAPGDNALGALADHVEVVETPSVWTVESGRWEKCFTNSHSGVEVLAIPYRHGGGREVIEHGLRACEEYRSTLAEDTILVCHLGISHEDTPSWLRKATSAIPVEMLAHFVREYSIDWAFSGDWHDRANFPASRITQVGALCPTGWDNPGLGGYGSLDFIGYDSVSGTRDLQHTVIPGPRFLKRNAVRLSTVAPDPLIYVQVTAAPGEVVTHSHPGVVEIVIDNTAVREAAAVAARGARRADTFAQALDAYLTTMPLPPEVSRPEVASVARRYLKL